MSTLSPDRLQQTVRCKRLLEVMLHVGGLGTGSLNTLGASRKVSAEKSPWERCWGQPSSMVGAAEVLPLLSPRLRSPMCQGRQHCLLQQPGCVFL